MQSFKRRFWVGATFGLSFVYDKRRHERYNKMTKSLEESRLLIKGVNGTVED